MKIEKIRIKNFKVYQDTEIRDLPNMCVFLGANGAGKSTLFEVFGFLSDALKSNVKTALNKRGGYKEVYSRNGVGDIEIEIKFRNPDVDGKKQPLITYELCVCLGENNLPVVSKEVLSYRRGNRGRPYRFLEFTYGKGNAIVNESEFESAKQEFKEQREEQTLDSPDILAIKGLGQFQKFNAISSFRRLLENWYVSNFQIQAAQNIEDTGLSEHLSTTGDNLAQVTKYIYENFPETFRKILDKMKERVPGIDKVEATETIDGRIVLQFSDGSFKDPFISRFVSDGTIKMFAYLVLLNDPKPHPLLCIEEPENYLHPELLIELAEEFRDYANRGGQVFISSHSPDFVNALELDELFWLKKENGFTNIKRASEDKAIADLFKDGDKLGYLWKQGYFIGSGPKN
ncbi:Predicted ATPase [Flavobacterium succinicans]|uniref:Predicted ATPase n=1 Tax=Flavobacterium succinicans TaxID=29536 RepID=A0A1I4R1D0_9FLAO|nr:AAA family ATPase [Flavobacterium succinicans]SFM46122.1 Predicted ATPase [Flavobacterium succinicans]